MMSTPLPTTAPTTTAAPAEQARTWRDKGMMVLQALALLYLFVMAISATCFFVSGLVFTVQEFADIPSCAEPYRAWMITILVLIACAGRKSTGNSSERGGAQELGYTMIASGILTGIVAGLGWYMVVEYPATTCDTSAMHDIIVWTKWFTLYCAAQAVALPIAGLVVLQYKDD